MQTARKPAAPRPARAAGRYWKGKAPKGVEASALSDSDSDAAPEEVGEDQEAIDEEEFELGGRDEGDALHVKKGVAKMSVALRDVDVRDGKVYVGGQEEEEEGVLVRKCDIANYIDCYLESEESEEEESKPKAPGAEVRYLGLIMACNNVRFDSRAAANTSPAQKRSQRKSLPSPNFGQCLFPSKSDNYRVCSFTYRHVRRARETIKKMEEESEFSEEAIKRRELEAEERKKASHDLVAESIKRELAESR